MSGILWIIGPGSVGATAQLNVSTYYPTPGNAPSVEILATDTGKFSSVVQLLSLPDSGGPSNNLQIRQTWNTNGSIALPTMPNRPSSGTADLTIDSQGNVAPQTSSLRFKENVEQFNDDFHKILALQPKSFEYKETGSRGIGYTAEELDELKLNHLVGYDDEGKPLTINYKMIPIYLLEVLKEQQSVIKELQAKVDALTASENT